MLGLRRLKMVAVLLVVIFLLQGCAAALVGGLLYKSAKSKEEKQEFMDSFRKTNLEREKAGLEPLDICQEMYYFDKGWAWEHKECRHVFEQEEESGGD